MPRLRFYHTWPDGKIAQVSRQTHPSVLADPYNFVVNFTGLPIRLSNSRKQSFPLH
ncbi:hypothetical protein BDM02DRAFT_3122467 [Thelephora ganbajun]|uniref:Uncharacterized protein n=1 Tax=Thelephora ganbajun TaxID=370292 RepID=A0ACB6Z343_THEGA|nr:hypothetical protein BDM02DRAFT_3122467 [Thelephora ganbajun]